MISPLVSIITVNFNQSKLTFDLIDSLRICGYPNLQIIVVDNGSSENPILEFQLNYPEVLFIRSEENLGFSGGNNLGIRKAKGEYLFFVNNDTVIPKGTIEGLLSTFQDHPKAGIVCPTLHYYQPWSDNKEKVIQYGGTTVVNPFTGRNKTLRENSKDDGSLTEPYLTAYPHGAAMMVPSYIVKRVGELPEDFFLYYEELDWSMSIKKAGYTIWVNPSVGVFHKESATVGKVSALKTYYINRNRVLFMRRHQSLFSRIGFYIFFIFFTAPKNLLLFLLKGQWEHFRAFIKAMTWHLGKISGRGNCYQSRPISYNKEESKQIA
jgi:GT2 family glycosyltransferase